MMAQRPVDGARGFIINYGSLNSYVVATDRVEYCASKAGIAMLTQVFARRLAPEQIYVYEVRPGVIDTPMVAAQGKQRAELYKRMTASNLIPRAGTAAEVAKGILFVIENDFVTGTTIDVDGGWLLS